MNPRLVALRAKRDGLNEKLAGIDEVVATRADLTMTDDEKNEYAELTTARAQVETDIEALSQQVERDAAVAATLARVGEALTVPAQVARSIEVPHVTPGEYASMIGRAHFGDASAHEQLVTIHEQLARATEATTDITGLLPTPFVGDLIKFVDASRPSVNSSRRLPMPDKGKVFQRPRVSQRTTAGTQTEGSALSSQKMTVTDDDITKTTQGGFVTLTEQDIDWSEPSALQILFEDLADSYSIRTETVTAAAIEASITSNKVTGYTPASSAFTVFHAKLIAAALVVYGSAKVLPDTLYAGTDVWAAIAGYLDSNNRPLFAAFNPQNTPAGSPMVLSSFDGGNPLALRLVVSPQFTSTTCIVAASRYIETYEQNKGLAQTQAASSLTLDVAYRGYFAANVYAQATCSMQTA